MSENGSSVGGSRCPWGHDCASSEPALDQGTKGVFRDFSVSCPPAENEWSPHPVENEPPALPVRLPAAGRRDLERAAVIRHSGGRSAAQRWPTARPT